MTFWIRLLTRRRGVAAAAVVAMSLAAIIGLTRLGFDDNYQDVFRSSDVHFQRLQQLADSFGTGDSDCVVLLESADMLSRSALESVRQFHARIADLPDVESVVSLYSIRSGKRVGRLFLPLFPGPGATDEQFDYARNKAEQNPLVVGRLLSKDRRAALVLVRLGPHIRSVDETDPVLATIRRIAGECTAGSDVRAQLTGMTAIRVETVRRLQHDQLIITVAGTTLATLVAWLLLRSLAAVVLVVVPALVGILWTMGMLGLAGQNLNAINIVLPALVMVIGVADSIHLVFHFLDYRADGASPIAAITASVDELAGACALTALTTSAGFFSLVVSDDQIIGNFGIFGGIGVLLTFLAVMILLPLLCGTRLGSACLRRSTIGLSATGWSDRFLDILAPRARWIAALLIAATFGFAKIASHVEADYRFTENLTDASESFRALRYTEQQFGGIPLLQILVEWPHGERLRSPQTFEVLAQTHSVVERNRAASAPFSILSLLESLTGTDDELSHKLQVLRYIPPEQLRSLVREDRRLALVTAHVPDDGAAALRAPLDELELQLKEIERRHPAYRLQLTGFAVVSTYRTTFMIMDLLYGLSLEIVVIFVVISLALRSPWIGLLSLPSNVFPMLTIVALIVATGFPMHYSMVLALNICLGIAVDDTVHFLTRYRKELKLEGDRSEALRRSFRAMMPVMVTTTVLMISGFGVGLFCSIPTLRAFSACSCLALIMALASEAIVLPSLIFALADARPVRK